MSNIHESNSGLTSGKEGSLTGESNRGFDKVAYQRELMRKKRAEEKALREHQEDREGRVDASDAVVDGEALPAALTEAVQVILTRTDRKFEKDRPGYYIFGKEENERECWKCGEEFKTRMELNKFCGPKCKDEWLNDAFGKLRKEKV